MRPASQRFFIHSCIYLRILIISYLATFLGTNSLSVLMCRKAVNQSINQSINQPLSMISNSPWRRKLLHKSSRVVWRQKIGTAVRLSLLSYIQADKWVIPHPLPVTGRYLWFTTYFNVRLVQSCCLIPKQFRWNSVAIIQAKICVIPYALPVAALIYHSLSSYSIQQCRPSFFRSLYVLNLGYHPTPNNY